MQVNSQKNETISFAASAQALKQGFSNAAAAVQHQSVACLVKVSAAAVLALTSSAWAQEVTAPMDEISKPAVVASNKKAVKSNAKDLFAGDKWHAVAPSWPGVLVFDEKTKRVSLKPMGANPFDAKYDYSVNADKKVKNSNKINGKMTFSDDLGRKSEMDFTLANNKKELTLEFYGGQRQEIYRRMSPTEVEAYEQKIRDMLAGKQPLPGR